MNQIQCWFCNKPFRTSKDTINSCQRCDVFYVNKTGPIVSIIFTTEKVFIEMSLSSERLLINGSEGFNNLANVDLKPFLTLNKQEITNKVHKLLAFI